VLPDGITLMGSQDSVGQQRLLYRTSLSGAEAQRAFVAALEAEGWQPLAAPNSAPRNGFVGPASLQAARLPAALCHEDHGNMEISGVDGAENRVLVRRFAIGAQASPYSCAEQNLMRQDFRGFRPRSAP